MTAILESRVAGEPFIWTSTAAFPSHTVGDLLGDHDRRDMGVAAWNPGHDRSIGDSQTDDSMHPPVGINYCFAIRRNAHPTSTANVTGAAYARAREVGKPCIIVDEGGCRNHLRNPGERTMCPAGKDIHDASECSGPNGVPPRHAVVPAHRGGISQNECARPADPGNVRVQ